MINRIYAICKTCEEKFILRYNIGNQFPQRVNFFCDTCSSDLEIGYDEKRKSIIGGLIIIDKEHDGIIKNLHPEIVIEEGRINDPQYFPSIEFMTKEDDLFLFKEYQYSIDYYFKRWQILSLNFRLLKDKKYNQLQRRFNETDHEIIKRKILSDVVNCIDDFIVGKWEKIYENLFTEFEAIKSSTNYNEFKTFLINEEEEMILVLFDTLLDYFEAREELLITLLAQKCNKPTIGLSSNISWKKIEMIYGNFYEVYGNLLHIPTALNNLKERNDYKSFNSQGFTFSNYLTIDKAGKTANFLNNPNLKDLGDYYYPAYRNGTHHRSSKIDKDNQKIILITGKSSSTTTVVNFTEYIESCNEIYARILILLKLSMHIIYEN